MIIGKDRTNMPVTSSSELEQLVNNIMLAVEGLYASKLHCYKVFTGSGSFLYFTDNDEIAEKSDIRNDLFHKEHFSDKKCQVIPLQLLAMSNTTITPCVLYSIYAIYCEDGNTNIKYNGYKATLSVSGSDVVATNEVHDGTFGVFGDIKKVY